MKLAALLCLVLAPICLAQITSNHPYGPPRIERGSRVFIEPMDGFENYLSAAFLKKGTPIVIVDDKAKADYIISGVSHVDRASWAKTIFISGASSAGASIVVKSKTGDLAFAYSVDKFNSVRASQSTAEACAKHLKNFIQKGE
jgi:hypothetical protein